MMLESTDLYPTFNDSLLSSSSNAAASSATSASKKEQAQGSKAAETQANSSADNKADNSSHVLASPQNSELNELANLSACEVSEDIIAEAERLDREAEQEELAEEQEQNDAAAQASNQANTQPSQDSQGKSAATASDSSPSSADSQACNAKTTKNGNTVAKEEGSELSSLIKPRSFASLQLRAKNAMKGLFALNRERVLVLCTSNAVDPIGTACDMVRELTGIEPTIAYAPTKFELFGNDKEDGILTQNVAEMATSSIIENSANASSSAKESASSNASNTKTTKQDKSLFGKAAGLFAQDKSAKDQNEAATASSASGAASTDTSSVQANRPAFNVVVMPCVHLIEHTKWLGMLDACLAQNDSLKLILVGDATDVAQLSMLWPSLDNAIHADIVLEFTAVGALQTLAGLISHYQRNDRDGAGLLPFSREALALLASYSCRLSGDRRYLGITELSLKALIYEANRFALLDKLYRDQKSSSVVEQDKTLAEDKVLVGDSASTEANPAFDNATDNKSRSKASCDFVSAYHVLKALGANDFRNNFLAESSLREHRDRQLLVATQGAVVGQINGLSVIETLGTSYEYGEPVRITATLRAGGEGDVIDIERKAELAGQIHAKAMMIINGFLTKEFGSVQPLPVSASLVFEQSYSEVDGDSASLTGLCAVISVLAGVPIRQDLAVTGAVDQFGDVQAVGGVNEKIEGFYRVCRLHGFTGTQGVIIPSSCVNQLVLRPSVIKAVKEGKFHIFTVSHVTEAVKMLTTLDWGDSATENTICYRICERLNNIIEGSHEESWFEQFTNRFKEGLENLKNIFSSDKDDESSDKKAK